MKIAIVSSAEIAAQPGAPLSADYWANRRDGESWPAYKARRKAGELEARAAELEARAAELRARAAELRGEPK